MRPIREEGWVEIQKFSVSSTSREEEESFRPSPIVGPWWSGVKGLLRAAVLQGEEERGGACSLILASLKG
jgi:hypothetical protein